MMQGKSKLMEANALLSIPVVIYDTLSGVFNDACLQAVASHIHIKF